MYPISSEILINAVLSGDVTVLDTTKICDLSSDLLDSSGQLRIVPAQFYANTTAEERALFGHRHGAYLLPTLELIEYLRKRIASRTAIEIGAGNGVVAKALGIPATDSLQQAEPSIVRSYLLAGQVPVKYGVNVEKLDAISAIRKYRPQVVLGCWVTHRYNPKQHGRGGNSDGIDELKLLSLCEEYIFIGAQLAHRSKPIMDLDHVTETPQGLYSRAVRANTDFVAIWRTTRR